MAIDTDYASLQASVATWLNRTDLGAVIPDFILIAEARIQNDVRLRRGISVSTLTTTANQQYVTLPADWLEFVHLSIDTEPLQYMPAERIRERADDATKDTPLYYAVEGDRLLLSPTPSAVETINITYQAKVPQLASYGVNWLLQKYPNIYLYGTLVSAYQYLMNEQKADYYGTLYSQAVAVAKADDVRAMSGGSPLTIRARSPR